MIMPDPLGSSVGTPDRNEHERALATRIRAGDEAAFTALFRDYYPGLCTYIHAYVQSGALAEELVMDIFRKLWEGRERWVVRSTVRAYLFSAAYNAAISYLRHQRHENGLVRAVSASVLETPALGHGPTGPAESLERAELAAAIARVVAELPERCRAVVLLWWQQDLKYAEIAAALGISVKTVESHLTRAAKILRERLMIFRS